MRRYLEDLGLFILLCVACMAIVVATAPRPSLPVHHHVGQP